AERAQIVTRLAEIEREATGPLAWIPFPAETLPPAVRDFVRAQAAANNCDEAMVGMHTLAVLGAAVGNSYRVRLRPTWTEPAAFWVVVVAPSGAGKSPAWSDAIRPVNLLEKEAHTEYEAERDAYEYRLERWNALSKAQRRTEEKPQPPTPARFRVADTTIEALALVHADTPRGLLTARDELAAWVGGFDRYTKGSDSDMSAFIEMEGGRPIRIDRKTGDRRSLYLASPCVSVCGTIQPDVLREQLTPVHFASGFAPRLLLCEPPTRRRRWSEAVATPDVLAAYERLVRDLYALPFGGEPRTVGLSPEAREVFVAFYDENALFAEHLPDGPLRSVLSKVEAKAARMALVFHLADVVAEGREDPGPVSASAMVRAVTLAAWLRHEQARLYERYQFDRRAQSRDTRLAGELPETFVWKDVAEAWGVETRSAAFKIIRNRLLPEGLAEREGHGRYRQLRGGHRDTGHLGHFRTSYLALLSRVSTKSGGNA
ncbi:MAG: YfjI family protein, partial [Bacteroidota bacterium]